jgi:hypothetical protein
MQGNRESLRKSGWQSICMVARELLVKSLVVVRRAVMKLLLFRQPWHE